MKQYYNIIIIINIILKVVPVALVKLQILYFLVVKMVFSVGPQKNISVPNYLRN